MTFHAIRAKPGNGSYAGMWKPVKSPRLATSFEPEILGRIHAEALLLGVPSSEIVRRRVRESYGVRDAND